jgi:hypothetical protein
MQSLILRRVLVLLGMLGYNPGELSVRGMTLRRPDVSGLLNVGGGTGFPPHCILNKPGLTTI